MMAELLDGYAMSNRILITLDSILRNDSDLQDFTIVSTENNFKNKSPVLYESHNLGLESWCIKPVYQYVCRVLFNQRKQLADHKLPYDKMENLNCFLNGALLINADMSTFWNMKRELVDNDITTVEGELQYSKIVLTYKSKSNEAFAYRRWLLKKILDKLVENKLTIPLNLLQDELAVVQMASEKSQNNYHSWCHRIWCIENIANQCSTFSNIIYSELTYTQDWINKHVSEHSGYHYRQFLIKLLKEHRHIISVFETYYNFTINKLELFKEDKYINLLSYLLGRHNKKKILEETCSYINYICILLYDLVVLFTEVYQHYFEHQSLYYHRRFLIYHLLRVPFDYHDAQFLKPNFAVRNINLWNENIITSETVINLPSNLSIKLFENVNSCNYALIEIITNHEKNFVSNHNNYLTRQYHKWLQNVIRFE